MLIKIACRSAMILLCVAATTTAQGEPAASPEPAAREEPRVPLKISKVDRLRPSFNPTAGQTVGIRFELTQPAKVTLKVYGPNRELIATLADSKPFPAGLSSVTWDGRDVSGEIVPDEAYTFDIRAIGEEEGDLWDPLLDSGGERVRAASVQPLDQHRLSYQLPTASRVLVRAAVVNGPLLRTLVNWEPRTQGLCIEYWDGMDEQGIRRVAEISDLRLAVAAMALPDQSIITIGNSEKDYRGYYLEVGGKRAHKAEMPRSKPVEGIISPHWRIPPHLNKDPRLALTILGVDDAKPVPSTQPAERKAEEPTATTQPAGSANEDVAVLTESPTLVRVSIADPIQREFMNDQKFELIVYLDDKRMLELEQGHVPFTYPLDLAELPAGRHVLTINVSSFRNHVGTVSRIIDVQR